MSARATKPKLTYSGVASEAFWKRINALPEPHHTYLYTMACQLQDAEYHLHDLLEGAEEAEEAEEAPKVARRCGPPGLRCAAVKRKEKKK